MKRNTDWLSGDISVVPRCSLSLGRLGKPEQNRNDWNIWIFKFFVLDIPRGPHSSPNFRAARTVHLYEVFDSPQKDQELVSLCYIRHIRIFESVSWDDGLWLSAIHPKPFVLCLRLFKTINCNLCLWLKDLFLMVTWERCFCASLRKMFLKATRICFVDWIRVYFLIQAFLWNLLRTVAYC